MITCMIKKKRIKLNKTKQKEKITQLTPIKISIKSRREIFQHLKIDRCTCNKAIVRVFESGTLPQKNTTNKMILTTSRTGNQSNVRDFF